MAALARRPSAGAAALGERARLRRCRTIAGGASGWIRDLGFTGGAVDPGESPVDAAVREAWEETGLHVEITGIFGVFGGPDFRVSYPNGDVADYVMHEFFRES